MEHDQTNSLTHYGVMGMRWGVRRSKSQLNSKIQNIKSVNKKLQNDRIPKYKIKSAKKHKQALKLRNAYRKLNPLLSITDLGIPLSRYIKNKSVRADVKGDKFDKKIKKAEQQIVKNKKMISVFENTIKDMSTDTITNGEQYISSLLMKYSREN